MNNYIKTLALGISLKASAFTTQAQKKISEGTATYTVSYELPDDKKQFESLMPKEIKCYFRGDSSATIINQGPAKIKSILNAKDEYQSLLIDVPMANKKIVVVLTPADQEKIKEKEPEFTGTLTTEKQSIAGYACVKVNATENKSKTAYEMWVTKDVELTPNAMTKLVNNLGGVPVKFTTYNNGVKINAQLKEIKEEKVPAGFFTATKDYEPLSMSDLAQISGGN